MILLVSLLLGVRFLPDVPVTDNDILMTRQEYGQTRRDRSVDGNKLTVAGTVFETGIGTHAVSMIPMTVPEKASVFQGICGVDDEAQLGAYVNFSISTGSEVIFVSDPLEKGVAIMFEVDIPIGVKKLYLLANTINDNNQYCHADWVDLKFVEGVRKPPTGMRIGRFGTRAPKLRARDFGLIPNLTEDSGPKFREMLTRAREVPGTEIEIDAGEYDFYPTGALNMSFHVSNHDQPNIHSVGFPLVDLHNVKINCNGALFRMHGLMLPVIVMDSENVTLSNLHIDFARNYYSEGQVVDIGLVSVTISIDKKEYPYHLEGDHLVFDGEGWTNPPSSIIAFEGGTNHIVAGTSDMGGPDTVVDHGDGRISFAHTMKNQGVKEGDWLVLRSWSRPHPGFFIYRSNGTVCEHVSIHSTQGMGLVGQRSTDITFIGGGTYVREGSGRHYSTSADATHFSNCRGLVKVVDGNYSAMMDDAINVHSTCLSIIQVISKSEISCKYVHGQSVGFETFLAGENVQFIKGPTLELSGVVKVKKVEKLSTDNIIITLDGVIPDGIGEGDAVENYDYYPSVVFTGNQIENNRARGSLFTTPKSVLVENNNFYYTSGSAILLAGDAQGWYESGACKDVVIRNNKFIDSLTSMFQFTNAILSFYPTINEITKQKEFYHRNIVIESNYFETFDVPLLYTISSADIEFRDNTIVYNDHFHGWGQKPFQFTKSGNITIKGNNVTPEKQFTIDDCQLTYTDASEIHFN